MNIPVMLPWQYTWVQNLPDIKSFAGHLWRFIFLFANDPSSAWSSKQMNDRSSLWSFNFLLNSIFIYLFTLNYKITKNKEIRLGRLEKS